MDVTESRYAPGERGPDPHVHREHATFLNMHAPSKGFADSLRARRDGRELVAERFDTFDPPADGGRPETDAVVRAQDEGEAIAVGASRVLFKAEAGDGEGTFCLLESTLAPGFPGPVPHLHERHVDTFFVVDGTLTLQVGGERVDAGPARTRQFLRETSTSSRTRASTRFECSTRWRPAGSSNT